MALSESGLAAQGILAGPTIVQQGGKRTVVRAKSGAAPSGKRNYYVKSKSSRRGQGRRGRR